MLAEKNKILIFRTRDELLRIAINQIAYFKADRNYTQLLLTNGSSFWFATNLG
jgi:hypothetical protein